jgi:threonine/homoserine/homoserine lactone efflux protein
VLAFVLTSLIVEITPGPNMGTLAALTLERGRKAGLAAVAGVSLGLLIVGALAALGLAAVLSESAALYQVLRWGGILYLLYLAYDAWRDAGAGADVAREPEDVRSLFLRGLTINILNPKAAIFYVAILPTFLDVQRGGSLIAQNLKLVAIYVLVATAVHSGIVLLAAGVRPMLVAGSEERIVRRALAITMAAIALWFAWETRGGW